MNDWFDAWNDNIMENKNIKRNPGIVYVEVNNYYYYIYIYFLCIYLYCMLNYENE
jgi:hypothetical protein